MYVSLLIYNVSRVVVAPVGSSFVDAQGAEVAIVKTSVGGVMSEGILCDSRMLGWSGGGVGVAAQVPVSIPIGSPPPATKPRPEDEAAASATTDPSSDAAGGLFEKKLSKEERKKLAAEKRLAKKAAKDKGTSKDNDGQHANDDQHDDQALREESQ
jgi:poly(3-hydroxybutyrate) depolymerase